MRQAALDAVSVEERLKIVLAGVMGEVEITKLDKRIAAEVKRSMDQNQREYYLHEQIKAIRKELGETEQNEAEEYMRRLKEKQMPADRARKAGARDSALWRPARRISRAAAHAQLYRMHARFAVERRNQG